MNPRRTVLIASLAATFGGWVGARAQAPAGVTEESLRDTIPRYVDAWNRHDLQAWAGMLTDDVRYTETTDFYQRMKGREAVFTFFKDVVMTTDLLWEIQKIRMMPDGTATVVLRHVSLVPPKVDGKYKSTFESVPSLSRWRHENGAWRMFFFTSHKGTALDAMKKDGVE
jgi:uncharacterized protein (TIGR02246 family)